MLSVVVPTFNEGKNIRNLVTQIVEALKGIDYEILFVDDSKDDTPQIIMEVAKDFPAVRMEHRTGESGLATAVLKGFRLAKGEYMACMDADLQHPPIVLKYMYKAMEAGADIIKIFPADLFGPTIIKDIKGPLPYAKLMPTGGVDVDNVDQWIKAGAVAVGAGSSLTKGAKTGDFKAITETAKQFIAKIKEARG